jgi:hypothetical protein
MDSNGRPLKNGYVRFRHNLSGDLGDLPQIWADEGLSVALPNPLPLEFDGFVPMSGVWLDIAETKKYSIDVMERIGADMSGPLYNVYWTMDNLPGFDFDNVGNISSDNSGLNDIPYKDSSMAVINGYWEPGDKGGGIFWWDSESVEAEDRGIVFKPESIDNGSPGRWKRVITGSALNSAFWGVYGKEIGGEPIQFQRMQNWLSANKGFTLIMNAGKLRPNGVPYAINLDGNAINFNDFKVIWEPGCVVAFYSYVYLREDCELPRGLVFDSVFSVNASHGIRCRVHVSNFNNEATLAFINGLLNQSTAELAFDAQLLGGGIEFFSGGSANNMPPKTRFHVILGEQPGYGGRKTLNFTRLPVLDGLECGLNLTAYKAIINSDIITLSDWARSNSSVRVQNDSFAWSGIRIFVIDQAAILDYIITNASFRLEASARVENSIQVRDIIWGDGILSIDEGKVVYFNSESVVIDGSRIDADTMSRLPSVIEAVPNAVIIFRGRLEAANIPFSNPIEFRDCHIIAPSSSNRILSIPSSGYVLFSNCIMILNKLSFGGKDGLAVVRMDGTTKISSLSYDMIELAQGVDIDFAARNCTFNKVLNIVPVNQNGANSRFDIENCNMPGANFNISVSKANKKHARLRCVNSRLAGLILQNTDIDDGSPAWSDIEFRGNALSDYISINWHVDGMPNDSLYPTFNNVAISRCKVPLIYYQRAEVFFAMSISSTLEMEGNVQDDMSDNPLTKLEFSKTISSTNGNLNLDKLIRRRRKSNSNLRFIAPKIVASFLSRENSIGSYYYYGGHGKILNPIISTNDSTVIRYGMIVSFEPVHDNTLGTGSGIYLLEDGNTTIAYFTIIGHAITSSADGNF